VTLFVRGLRILAIYARERFLARFLELEGKTRLRMKKHTKDGIGLSAETLSLGYGTRSVFVAGVGEPPCS